MDEHEREEEDDDEEAEEESAYKGSFDGPAPFSNWTTSRQAAEELEREGKLKTQRMRVYHALATHGPLACFQGRQRTGLTHQGYTARIRELVVRHMAERLVDTLRDPVTGKAQEKVRALPPHLWREFVKKPKKRELIELLCESLLAFVRRPDMRDTDERRHAVRVLALAGWKLEEGGWTQTNGGDS